MIGIFDSGVGGLTVARAIERLLPDHPLLYFGDTARTPYGTKSAKVIIDYSLRNTEFLVKNGARYIVIGCNSASSVATERLRREFDVPILEVITPAAERAVEVSTTGRIGVIGTRATIGSNVYEQTIASLSPHAKVYSRPCPLLVPLVEEGWKDSRETKMIIRRYLHPLKNKQIDTLILACTHYPLLKKLIQQRIGRKVILIDSSIETARILHRRLEEQGKSSTSFKNVSHRIFFSDVTASARQAAASIFNHPVEVASP